MHEYTLTFDDSNAFAEWIAGWMCGTPHLAQLPKELQNRFIDDVIKNYLPLVPPNAQGHIAYTLPVLTIVACKPG